MEVNLVYDSPIIVIGFRSLFTNQFSPEIILQDGRGIGLDKSYNLHQAYANAFEKFKKIVKGTDNEIDLRDTNKSLEDFAIGKKLKILIEKCKLEINILKIKCPMIEASYVHEADLAYHTNKKMIEQFENLLKEIDSK